MSGITIEEYKPKKIITYGCSLCKSRKCEFKAYEGTKPVCTNRITTAWKQINPRLLPTNERIKELEGLLAEAIPQMKDDSIYQQMLIAKCGESIIKE